MRHLRGMMVFSTGIGLAMTVYISRGDTVALIGASLVLIGWFISEDTVETFTQMRLHVKDRLRKKGR